MEVGGFHRVMLSVPVPVLWLYGSTKASESFVVDFTGVKISVQIKVQPKGTRWYSFSMKS